MSATSAASPSTGMAIRCRRPRSTSCLASDAVLLGAIGGPKWSAPDAKLRPETGLLRLRRELGVYANLRPVAVHPALADSTTLKPEVVRGVDLVFVRELTGGIYFGAKTRTATRSQRPVQLQRGGNRARDARGRRAWRSRAAASSLPSTSPTCWKPRACGARWSRA